MYPRAGTHLHGGYQRALQGGRGEGDNLSSVWVGARAEEREGVTQLLPAVSEGGCTSQVDIIKLDFLFPAIAFLLFNNQAS